MPDDAHPESPDVTPNATAGAPVGSPSKPEWSPETPAILEIDPQELAKAVAPLPRIGVLRVGEEAVLSFDGNHFLIEIGGMGLGVPAFGLWRGQARVAGKFVRALAEAPPADDPVVFKIKAGRLHVGEVSVECVWQAPGAKTIDLPVTAGLAEFLHVADNYSEEEIASSGLAGVVQQARAAREERIRDALESLVGLGVTDAQIQDFVLRINRSQNSKPTL